MKFEHRFALVFGSVLIGVVAIFSSLFEKYTFLTAFQFAQSCTQTIGTFLSSPYHWTGIAVLSLVLILSSYFVAKVLFSALKTHRHLKVFTAVKLRRVPQHVQLLTRKHVIAAHTLVMVKNTQPVAFAMGLFHPKIVITSGLVKLLTATELEAVLLHELYHLRHRHSLLLLGAEITASTLSFLPSLFDLLKSMKSHLEYAADSYAVQQQHTEKYLLAAIQKVMAYEQPYRFEPAFGVTIVEQRIHKLTHHTLIEPSVSNSRALITAGSIFIFGLLLMLPAPTQVQAVEGEGGLISVENCGDGLLCSIRCRNPEPLYTSQEIELKMSPGLSSEPPQSPR